MRRMTACLVALMFPLMLGTTYIVRENGKEVGTWVEKDGSDVTRYIDNTVIKTGSQAIAEQQNITPDLVMEARRQEVSKAQLAREKEEDFGIRVGMTREDLESLAAEKGLRRTKKYTDNDSSIGKSYWIYEYDGKTDHFKHSFTVYVGDGWKVLNVIHRAEQM